MKKLIFGLLAIIGLMVAVCTANDSPNELLRRGIGTGAFALFTYLGGWWEKTTINNITNTKKQQNDENQSI